MTPAPRAIRHFGLAAIENRARRTASALAPKPPAAPAVRPQRMGPVRRRTVIRLWLPATFLFLLLAPFAFLLAPCIYLVSPRAIRTPPFATAIALGRVLLSLGGTVVDIDTPDALVSLRIF